MLSIILTVLRDLAPSNLGKINVWYLLVLWVATTAGFVFLHDGLLVNGGSIHSGQSGTDNVVQGLSRLYYEPS